MIERDDQYGSSRPGAPIASASARLAIVARWPLTLELDVDGLGNVLVCHSTPVVRRADLHADHA